MISLSNQFKFEIAVASGALAFNGLGWPWEQPLRWVGVLRPQDFDVVIAKTVTSEPRRGNLSWWHPWTCVRWLGEDSAVNAVGLTNPGMASFMAGYMTCRWPNRDRLALSVRAESFKEAMDLAFYLKILSYNGATLPFVEVNLSCPNIHDSGDLLLARDIVHCLNEHQPHPLVVKLSNAQCRSRDLVQSINPFVEAFSAINTVPWGEVYPGSMSPIERYSHHQRGGVSGCAIHSVAVESVAYLREITDRPIIGGGGIFTMGDMEDFRRAGATAFSMGSVFLRYPWRPNRLVKQWRDRYPYDRTDGFGTHVA